VVKGQGQCAIAWAHQVRRFGKTLRQYDRLRPLRARRASGKGGNLTSLQLGEIPPGSRQIRSRGACDPTPKRPRSRAEDGPARRCRASIAVVKKKKTTDRAAAVGSPPSARVGGGTRQLLDRHWQSNENVSHERQRPSTCFHLLGRQKGLADVVGFQKQALARI